MDSKEPSESGDGGGGSGGGFNKAPKRSKVTAVACQPCQKRKSKCDGQRPICSSCQSKGRTDCVYDSSSDLRRTSALKQRIDTLQNENVDLRDIILSICGAVGTSNIEAVVRLVHQTLGQGDFSRVPELAEVLRNHQVSAAQSRPQFQPQPLGTDFSQASRYGPQPQQVPYPYLGPNPSMMQDAGMHASPSDTQSDWGSAMGGVDSQGHDDSVPGQQRYFFGGQGM